MAQQIDQLSCHHLEVSGNPTGEGDEASPFRRKKKKKKKLIEDRGRKQKQTEGDTDYSRINLNDGIGAVSSTGGDLSAFDTGGLHLRRQTRGRGAETPA
jgi:hypothetical protein